MKLFNVNITASIFISFSMTFSCFFGYAQQVDKPAKRASYLQEKEGSLYYNVGQRDLLGFQYQMHYPPPGVDTFYKRSGYIHPLNTPHGQTITRINAPDHYHHFGMWNPWTRIHWKGREYDLWNLADRKGTVRFVEFTDITDNNDKTSFTARLNHIVNTGKKDSIVEQLIMQEFQTIRFHPKQNSADQYFFDLEIELRPVTDSPVILKEYRYGGLGFRATDEWNKNNSQVLTSAGLSRKQADGSLAKWVLAEGSLGNETGGMLWFAHPENYNYPEPLRVWPEDSNGDGDVFINFSPTKTKDWVLSPGKIYRLRYRVYVYNGSFADKTKVDKMYEDYLKQVAGK